MTPICIDYTIHTYIYIDIHRIEFTYKLGPRGHEIAISWHYGLWMHMVFVMK